ncbi:hypothetical protein [Mesorhizobium loti]|uniref:hypothetical protein n=1 Tax=Rhizobium loti TaxID=381 RepID=UPI0003F9195B|nr:hypothetical protein [Mesorhizobium loti]
MEDEHEPGGTVSAHDSHILKNAFKASVAELQLPEAQWAEHATAMLCDLTGSLHVDTSFIDWIYPQVKNPSAAKLANDNVTPEDHLAAVTLAIHATLRGLAAPVDMLIEALSFEAPADATARPSARKP